MKFIYWLLLLIISSLATWEINAAITNHYLTISELVWNSPLIWFLLIEIGLIVLVVHFALGWIKKHKSE